MMKARQDAQGGDGTPVTTDVTFRELTEPYRRELHVHCYRMLGSFQDAEDALQETLLAAWQGFDGYEGRASLRTWLYRIATNRCLNARRAASRRPAKQWDVPGVQPPEPTRLGDIVWLEPFPDSLLEGAMDVSLGPEARYEQTEAISLAFVTALQALPPRQLAVLVLRDVMGFHAGEVADMLDTTADSVNSALKRARATLHGRQATPGRRRFTAGCRLARRAGDRREVRARVGVGRRGGADCTPDGRRRHLHAAHTVRVRGQSGRGQLLRQHFPRGSQV
jgi:RNA polymerase sigma-70 factor (TIGR02960 family)